MFPWGCLGDELDDVRSHPTFAHSVPRPLSVLLSVVRYFRWAHIAIISSSDDLWVETATKVWVLFSILSQTDDSASYIIIISLKGSMAEKRVLAHTTNHPKIDKCV